MGSPKLSTRLDELLKERGLSSTRLAEQAGVTLRAVSGLRRNTAQLLDVHTTARICEALEITPGELFLIENENHSQP
jgi:putative transcriptional regulator